MSDIVKLLRGGEFDPAVDEDLMRAEALMLGAADEIVRLRLLLKKAVSAWHCGEDDELAEIMNMKEIVFGWTREGLVDPEYDPADWDDDEKEKP